MESQTIIWHKPTGKILSVLPNKYISKRADLILLAPGYPLPEIAFFYEHQPIDISTAEDRVKQIVSGQPPVVLAPGGFVKSYDSFIRHRRNQISSAQTILCHFEGGMGDQILQAEAVSQFYDIFKEKELFIAVPQQYFDIIKHIPGLKNLYSRSALPPKLQPDLSVDMATPYISDPRGGLYGKASLYGASIGLKSVHRSVSLKLPPIEPPIPNGFSVGIHIRSGSGHGKSWNTEPAETLAKMFIKKDDAEVYFFGENNDWQMVHPQAHRIDTSFPWLKTAYVIQSLALLICIDSGPMHLARALGTPHIILWGGTSYRDILGREKEDHDLRLDIPCIDQVCYDCPKGIPLCMRGHDPQLVYEKGKAYAQKNKKYLPDLHPSHGQQANVGA